MSSQTPNKIYESFKNNILDETRASELLISLIENGSDKNYRIQVLSLKLLGLIGSNKNFVFNFLENLLISDLDEYIRGKPASFIITNFPEKARILMQMTDTPIDQVKFGMPVELTFRKYHDGNFFHNYFWQFLGCNRR